MRLFLLQIIYIGTVLTSVQLDKLIKKHTKYEFHIYNIIRKEFVKIYYSKDIEQFIIEIDNVIVNKKTLELGFKLQIDNIWNLEN